MIPEFRFLGCRPVIWNLPGRPTPVYPGSVKSKCGCCRREVWVGPKGQEHLEGEPLTPIMCFPCGDKVATRTVVLGNDHKRKDSE